MMMKERRVQMQPADGTSYYRLRLPFKQAKKYIERNGEEAYISIHSSDTFRIDNVGGTPIRIVKIRELRGIMYRYYWMISLPKKLSCTIQKGDRVRISLYRNRMFLHFEHDVISPLKRNG